jgi:HK97 family phage major capsid protein
MTEVNKVEQDAISEVEQSLKSLVSKMQDEVGATVANQVKELVKEHLELKEKKAGVYNSEVQADEKRKNINSYLHKFVGALYSNDQAKLKELSTDATGSPYGGYVVDSELSAEIRHLITEYGVARREMMTVQLSKNTYRANNLVTDVTVGWVDEGAVIGSTQVVLGQETLELEKLAAIVTLTSELLEDQEVDLLSFVGSRVAEAFAKEEDTQFFQGTGTPFTGLLNVAGVNEVEMTSASIASMDADDLIAMVDETPQGALSNAKFYMHRTLMSLVRKLKDLQGQYIYQPISATGPATIWGYPVVLVEAMPSFSDDDAETSFVLFGDLKKACILGYKGAITATVSNSAVVRNVANNADINTFTTDREAVRWTERVGYIAILPNAVTKLTTGADSV